TYHKANPSDAPIVMLALTSATRSPGELYDLAESKIEQAMGQIKGVGDVSLMGSALPAVRIDLQPLKLIHAGISLDTVRSAVANSTTTLPKGSLQGSSQSWMVDGNG
ncbi:efflux RND transporter permease subunit, partial [Pantoea ananatis]